ncbi:hypothetical protein DY000_02015058 [Brassica cretica]|uniref:Uncharacterized protein n=1 Tax=Brassica cretica TaxID=69181 RepID=A0ABQ7CY51_BRACR|nr:hypothetical protein DY000_02015058 [Brassica cretica]
MRLTPHHAISTPLMSSCENSPHHAVSVSFTPSCDHATSRCLHVIRHHVHTFHVVSTTSRYYVTSLTGTPHPCSGDESCQLTRLPHDPTRNDIRSILEISDDFGAFWRYLEQAPEMTIEIDNRSILERNNRSIRMTWYMPSSTRSNKKTQPLFSPDPASLERLIRKEARSLSTDNNPSVSLDSAQPPSTQTPVPSTDSRSPLWTDNTDLPSTDIIHPTSIDIPSRTSILSR